MCLPGLCVLLLQPLIVPRVVAELGGQDLNYLLQRPGETIAMLVDEVEKHGFDGLVGSHGPVSLPASITAAGVVLCWWSCCTTTGTDRYLVQSKNKTSSLLCRNDSLFKFFLQEPLITPQMQQMLYSHIEWGPRHHG
jgi:hypothetical protein